MAETVSERIAILVDGGFYLRRAKALFGEKDAKGRADELYEYCLRHLKGTGENESGVLYRLFYYDCPPIDTTLYHPLTKEHVNMRKTARNAWTKAFFNELANKRKLAIRLGELQERESGFRIRGKAVKRICRGDMTFDDLTEEDFELDLVQKGVDMRIGLDIASLADKRLVTRIVLIAGDSDFVPAAKHARREGIDFVLDPMWQGIRKELNIHIDGLHSCTPKRPSPETEPLCVRTTSE